ncbi:hypothetical protein [Halomonas sp. NO4]|uniref:hypothetical protein n=1 Tax=Halomonas sp. NO4 TaxID=2484813 RepID=UPI0013D76261|nr:hypothetical protein [Halomonas sp. NO4]
MKINLDLGTVALLGLGGYLLYRLTTGERPAILRPVQPDALGAAGAWLDWNLGTWDFRDWDFSLGGGIEPYGRREADEIAAVAERINQQTGWNSGSMGSL